MGGVCAHVSCTKEGIRRGYCLTHYNVARRNNTLPLLDRAQPSRRGIDYSAHGSWANMKARCHNSNHPRYGDYGGRGIVVCERWKKSYEAFLEDMGPRPSPIHSVDRIDNNGGYKPGNVRWATPNEQANNKRGSRCLDYGGVQDSQMLTTPGGVLVRYVPTHMFVLVKTPEIRESRRRYLMGI